MSSSNQVRLAYIAEATYGTTPGSGNFDVIRTTGEGLSGTPRRETPNEIRSDRQPIGSKQVGLELGGNVGGLLAPTTWINDMAEAALMDTYNAKITTGAATLTIGGSGTTITRSAGDFTSDGFAVGDIVETTGFTTAANNTFVYVSAVTTTVLTVVGPAGFTDEVGGGDEAVVRHAYVEIGTDDHSFSIEKNFQDLTTKTISYRGMRVNTMNVSMGYGALCRFDVTFAGGGDSTAYETPGTEMTNGRTVNAIGTEDPLNGTLDMGLIVVDGAVPAYCIRSINISLNNNMQPQECAGQLAPKNQIAMKAIVSVSMEAYLSDDNFDFHDDKINDTTKAICVANVDDNGEGYAFAIPAMTLQFPDAAAAGENQQVMLSITGEAEPTTTLNAFRVYKVTQA